MLPREEIPEEVDFAEAWQASMAREAASVRRPRDATSGRHRLRGQDEQPRPPRLPGAAPAVAAEVAARDQQDRLPGRQPATARLSRPMDSSRERPWTGVAEPPLAPSRRESQRVRRSREAVLDAAAVGAAPALRDAAAEAAERRMQASRLLSWMLPRQLLCTSEVCCFRTQAARLALVSHGGLHPANSDSRLPLAASASIG